MSSGDYCLIVTSQKSLKKPLILKWIKQYHNLNKKNGPEIVKCNFSLLGGVFV